MEGDTQPKSDLPSPVVPGQRSSSATTRRRSTSRLRQQEACAQESKPPESTNVGSPASNTPIKLKIRHPTGEPARCVSSEEMTGDIGGKPDLSTSDLPQADTKSEDAEEDGGTEGDNDSTLVESPDNGTKGVRRTKTKGQIKKQLMKMKDRKAENTGDRTPKKEEQSSSPSLAAPVSPPMKDELLVGDLLLGRVSGHPYWPCMVAYDPFLGIYSRLKNNKSREYHVEFFGNEGERGWVGIPRLIPFQDTETFETWCAEMRRVNKKDAKNYMVKPSRKKAWEIGMQAAADAMSMDRMERKQIFTHRYLSAKPELPAQTTVVTEADTATDNTAMEAKKKSVKRKRQSIKGNKSPSDAEMPPKKRQKLPNVPEAPSEESDPDLSPSHIQLPEGLANQNAAQYMVFCQKRRDLIRREHPGYSAEKILDILAQQWSELDEEQQSKFIPMGSDVKHLSQIMIKCLAEEGPKEPRPVKPPRKKSETAASGQPIKKRKSSSSLAHPMASRIPVQLLDQAPMSMECLEHIDQVVDSVASGAGDIKPVVDEDLQMYFAEDCDTTIVAEDQKEKPSTPDDENASTAKHSECLSLKAWKPPKLPGDNGVDDYELEIFRLSSSTSLKKESICHICEQPGDLIQCEGPCNGTYHLSCLGLTVPPAGVFRCDECGSGRHTCFVCKDSGNATRRCCAPQCGRYYHEDCIQRFPLTKTENSHITCPLHTCATCAADNPKAPGVSKGRMYKCVRCPTAYHAGDFCIAAGSIHLAGLHIVCSRHFRPVKSQTHHSHINVSWCFICSKGGTLLCCESCPAAFHSECLKINPPNDKWYCADCARGKRPRYGDIVWVKLGSYRWWPGEICQPKHVPLNIQNKVHQVGEFPMRFFGSHDYFWTHQARVFLFQEGDKGSKDTTSSTSLARIFHKAVSEATMAFKIWCMAKTKREEQEQEKNDRKPGPYKHIKTNIPIAPVVIQKADLTEIPRCECRPNDPSPCGQESECLNRMMMYECHPATCPAKDKCQNQRFTKREYPACQPSKTPGRGWGLKALQNVKKGSFVHEYVGDLVDEDECHRRIKEAHVNNISNFYMLTVDKNRIIDAGPKGNFSRFMNHSCQPNCETQKWNVNGDVRVGLFAMDDILEGSELTFNYNLECLGNEKKACQCGAKNCSGFLGVRPKTILAMDAEKKMKDKKKKKRKLKQNFQKEHEDDCYRCGEGGELVMCDKNMCPKAYHLKCLNLGKLPHGKWICPWHHCDECGKRAVRLCSECPNSFCAFHIEKNIFQIGDDKLVCSDHSDFLNAVEVSKLTILHNDPSLEVSAMSSSEMTSSESSPTHSDADNLSLPDNSGLGIMLGDGNNKGMSGSVSTSRRSSRTGSGDSDVSEGRLCIVEEPDSQASPSGPGKKRGRPRRPSETLGIPTTEIKLGNGTPDAIGISINTQVQSKKVTKARRGSRASVGSTDSIGEKQTSRTKSIELPSLKSDKIRVKRVDSPMFDNDEDDFPDLVIDMPSL